MACDALVSIIVPIYRMERLLPRCIASLLAQSHQNLDIILVDDGSPDRSGEICDEFTTRDARVSVLHQANAGPSAARNAGIDRAQGDYITFVDPDDWIHTDMVARLVALAVEGKADLVVCRFLRTESEDVSEARVFGGVRAYGSDEALRLYAGPTTSWMTSPCAKLFASRLFDGVRFPVGRLYEDEFTTYRLVAAAHRVVVSEAELYFYFTRPGSATQGDQGIQQLLDRVDALREQAVFFESRGMPHVSGNCLRRAFFIQRQLRSRVGSAADSGLRRRLAQQTTEVASALRESQESLLVKAFSSVYAVWPQPVDVAIQAYQTVRRRPGGERARTPPDGRRRPKVRRWVHGRIGTVASSPEHGGGRIMDPPKEHVSQSVTKARGPEVVVVAYGSPDMLRQALEPVRELPVTVVDNSSLPEIKAVCERLGCRYIDPGRNGGFAAGVNVGLTHRGLAGADVLLLNPDAVIDAEAVHALHKALHASADLASVGPRQVDEFGKEVRVTWPFPSPWGSWLHALGLSRLLPRSEYVSGAILLLRAEALGAVGGLDERFFLYSEEADWAFRARRVGWRHAVISSVTAMHIGGGTSSDETHRQAHFHASQERFLRKHYGALGWQFSRVGQILGDAVRSAVRRGPVRDRLRARVALYLKGPVRVEARLPGSMVGE